MDVQEPDEKGSDREIWQSVRFGNYEKEQKGLSRTGEKADDIGGDNPMAYNELFALVFVAPYVASEKKSPRRQCRR